MKEKLIEARDICAEIMCDVEGRFPIGVVRCHRLLEEVLAELDDKPWDWDDVITLPFNSEQQPDPAA